MENKIQETKEKILEALEDGMDKNEAIEAIIEDVYSKMIAESDIQI